MKNYLLISSIEIILYYIQSYLFLISENTSKILKRRLVYFELFWTKTNKRTRNDGEIPESCYLAINEFSVWNN